MTLINHIQLINKKYFHADYSHFVWHFKNNKRKNTHYNGVEK